MLPLVILASSFVGAVVGHRADDPRAARPRRSHPLRALSRRRRADRALLGARTSLDHYLAQLLMSGKPTVGLTGGIGSGKSSVARLFEALGVAVIDTDAIAHELTAPGGAAIPAIGAAFGPEVIDAARRARSRADARAGVPRPRGEEAPRGNPAPDDPRRERAATRRRDERRTSSSWCRCWSSPAIRAGAATACSWWTAPRRCRSAGSCCAAISRAARCEAIMATQASRAARLARADDVIDNGGDPGRLGTAGRGAARTLSLARRRVIHRAAGGAKRCQTRGYPSESVTNSGQARGRPSDHLRVPAERAHPDAAAPRGSVRARALSSSRAPSAPDHHARCSRCSRSSRSPAAPT